MTIDQLLVYFFGACALLGGVLMLVARHPMRVALALISCMLSLAGIYAMLGVHVVAVFQVLIYVGAVMVFMVYVIMLLDVRDPSFLRRYSRVLLPGVVLGALLAGALGISAIRLGAAAIQPGAGASASAAPSYLVQPFSVEFLREYWLHFELTSVLLVAAVVAAIAIIRSGRRSDG
ncbi:MAG: NADH-quinone oxidoreductase subunit J [Gammaproteobacteria bacterium]|jgi:NADH-quinone oxidoreductase subunit J|nr:NADH-quinone oxidoreductase subunit J [Gammaproteobacteria bacterium]